MKPIWFVVNKKCRTSSQHLNLNKSNITNTFCRSQPQQNKKREAGQM